MAYTSIDNPELHFQTKLYTGTGSSHAVTGVGFAPNWVWLKSRSTVQNHLLFDTVRGATKKIMSNTTDEEQTEAQYLKSFDSDGFTLGTRSEPNESGETFVSWNWNAGTSFTNDASSTGIGSIDSSGSVSDTAGFSIVIRTGTASAGTIKHGLSTTPKMIITKMRNAAENWGVYHVGIGNTKYLKLDVTDAEDSSSGVWNNTTPTTSVFSVGNSALVNGSGKTYVDYIFSEVKGYSKIGSYTGNGNTDGTYVHLGFKPAWVMIKRTDGTNSWVIYDNKREGYNVDNDALQANGTNAEGTSDDIDLLSSGFKMRTSGVGENGSGNSYIYMAFAESPFVNSNGVPNNAR